MGTELKDNSLEEQAKGTSSRDKVPMWFKEGAIKYFAQGWPIITEDKLRLSFNNNIFTNWQQVLAYEPRLAGQAFCYFLSEHYQPKVVAQIFFQLRKKPLPRAIRLVTKHTLDTLYAHCFDYYQQRFAISNQQKTAEGQIKIKHPKGIVSNVLLNQHGDYLAYILTTYNKRTVYITDLKSQVTKRITNYQLPPWIDDHSADLYPLLQWHPDGRQLYVAMPKKGKITISRYTTDGTMQEAVKLYGIDGINIASFTARAKFSA